MKSAIGCAIVALLSGCVEYPETGKHVPIEGSETQEQKVDLAKRVLAVLPAEKVREQVRQRYPQLSAKQLKRINVEYAPMQFIMADGTQRQEVHLIVTVWEDATLAPIASDIEEFVASLFRAELARLRSGSPINLMQPTATRAGARAAVADLGR